MGKGSFITKEPQNKLNAPTKETLEVTRITVKQNVVLTLKLVQPKANHH